MRGRHKIFIKYILKKPFVNIHKYTKSVPTKLKDFDTWFIIFLIISGYFFLYKNSFSFLMSFLILFLIFIFKEQEQGNTAIKSVKDICRYLKRPVFWHIVLSFITLIMVIKKDYILAIIFGVLWLFVNLWKQYKSGEFMYDYRQQKRGKCT